MSLGERIRAARKNAGYTQKEVADLVGATNTAISNWEKDINKPDVDTLEKLCGALGVTARYFLPADTAPASPLREKYGILPGMDVDEIVEVFHKNPKLGVLFSRSANLSDKDIDFMLEMIDRMNPDDD